MYQQHIQDDIALQQDSSSYEYGHTKSMIQYDVSRLGNSKRKHVSNKEGIKKRCSDKIHTLFNPNRMTPPPTQALDSSETIPIDHNADDIQVGSDDVTKVSLVNTASPCIQRQMNRFNDGLIQQQDISLKESRKGN
ncbi:unnamed protein product [Didymodactylos carnosus]|uniref:Uncharacterized protein n=1 Tax=Didymodactylos carnosus TaxID=1234261 RepID=A0A815JUK2_9BILA|nr:unnamed protein product [Didymodactylos carnosus]CAF4281237.1 unnamed protein product [Didymodactylos carnosus]